MQGCRGRSPRRNKLWGSPFPPGRGSGGWGQEGNLMAGVAGDKEGKPPAGCLFGTVCKCRRRFSAGVPGAKPPGEINLGSPPSPEGKGVGGMGARRQTKGRICRRQGKQTPRRMPSTPAEPARQRQSPRRHHSGRAIRRPEPAPPIPPPSAPPQPSPQGRHQAPPPEASVGKTQAPARQPFRQQRRGKIRSSTG